ncbi:MAG: COX15/CtaA family protein, partial [Pseudomonadota bacterium]
MTQYAIANGATKWIQVWLLVLGVLVYAMILVGGATRLTDSGLSITEWAPLSGAVPPLSAAAWDAEFAAYRETAEYRLQNAGMSMSEFQWIYWWEWGHRQLGRLIGLVAIVGFVWFALAKWIDRPLARRMLLLIGLGGLQGFIGWWMVSSGIGDTTRVDVAPYRLMTHFCLALLIIGTIAWTWLDIASDRNFANTAVSAAERRVAICLLVLVGFQMAAGALVAGHDAGRTYTDWPLMAGET